MSFPVSIKDGDPIRAFKFRRIDLNVIASGVRINQWHYLCWKVGDGYLIGRRHALRNTITCTKFRVCVQTADTPECMCFASVSHLSGIRERTSQSQIAIPAVTSLTKLKSYFMVGRRMRKFQFALKIAVTHEIAVPGELPISPLPMAP